MTQPRLVAVLANLSRRFDRRAIQGVMAYMRETAGWNLYVEEDPLQKLPKLDQWDGDGIIADFDDHKIAVAIRGLAIPVVGFGGGRGWYDSTCDVHYFTTDNRAIGRLAAEHLLNCGFTRLAFYGNPRRRLAQWSEEREQAFGQRAAEAHVPCLFHHGRHADARHWLRQVHELSTWLESLPKPIGLMACTDIRARQALEACRRIDAHVPEDIAVIGVDNDEMICQLTAPPLSSIEQGSRQIGYQAASLLDRLMAGRKLRPSRHVIPPEVLTTRQSTDVMVSEDTDLTQAIRFVREHACDPICVADVLRIVPLSRSTLENRFRSSLGRTVHAEIQRVQIEHARQLLAQTDLLIKQIAIRCGFKYVPHMTRVFHQHVGLSPGEYRRRLSPNQANNLR